MSDNAASDGISAPPGFDELAFFDRAPDALPVYAALRRALAARWPQTRVRVGKTQISFYNRHLFAMASLPRSKRGAARLLVSFGLGWRLDDPRVAAAAQPYPNRWTHHLPVARPEEIDAQLMDWLAQAWHFSMGK